MPLAFGSITLIDLNDAKSLTAYLASSQAKTQIFNPNATGNAQYIPDWTTNNVVITPSLFVSGDPNDVIASATKVTWYEAGNPTPIANNTNYSVGTSGARTLTIKTNILAGKTSQAFICEIVWKDPTTGLDVTTKTDIDFAKVNSGTNGSNGTNGQNAVSAFVWNPTGSVVRNGQGTVTAECNVYNGANKQTTGVTYQWYKLDPSVTTSEGGGVGWKKLTSTTAQGTTGYDTATLTIPASAIDGQATFKCVATYASKPYEDACTVSDQTDPIQCIPTSPQGNIIKNGQGDIVVTARTYQNGVEVDADGTKYAYKWYKYNSSGVLDTAWGTNGSKTGQTQTIKNTDISGKATFHCQVDKK